MEKSEEDVERREKKRGRGREMEREREQKRAREERVRREVERINKNLRRYFYSYLSQLIETLPQNI